MHTTLDLATDKHLTPSLQIQCYKIAAGVFGPFTQGTVGMVLGKSGLTTQGFIVQPGIINEDFKGEIKLKA